MGANDVANAFGTTVGSKSLTIVKAYILASIFEALGSILIGYNVIDTIRKSIVTVSIYEDSVGLLLLGQIATLGGCALWLFVATVLKLPISATHSIIGASLGFTLVCKGFSGVQWNQIMIIASSWFISPVLAGFIAVVLYLLIDHLVLRKVDPVRCGLRNLPIFFFLVITCNCVMITREGSRVLNLRKLDVTESILLSTSIGLISSFLIFLFYIPKLKKFISDVDLNHVKSECSVSVSNALTLGDKTAEEDKKAKESEEQASLSKPSNHYFKRFKKFFDWLLPDAERIDTTRTLRLFTAIQIFTACFAAFAHGANDVSNAIAPLSAIFSIYRDFDVAQKGQTPLFVLIFGVFSICSGLWILGHKVIDTIGKNMSEINAASGFCIDFGSAVTVLVSSKYGLPVSTTHCLVGSVVAVGSLRGIRKINWALFRNVAISWVITLPVSAAFSAIIMIILRYIMQI
ncbi:unnamed protein product [Auanema sp. JU1783]|nr:unnamed protein product [Auanema sp. JU1783]